MRCSDERRWKLMAILFFFQAEDGIRYLTVTGVQTCALPISWFTSSPRLGTSGSWQTTTKDCVPAGAPLQARCGLRLDDSATCEAASGTANANSPGIAWPSWKLWLMSCMSDLSCALNREAMLHRRSCADPASLEAWTAPAIADPIRRLLQPINLRAAAATPTKKPGAGPGFSWWVPEGLDGSVARSSRGAKACFRAHLLRGEDGAFLGSLGALVEHREQPHAHEADGHGEQRGRGVGEPGRACGVAQRGLPHQIGRAHV